MQRDSRFQSRTCRLAFSTAQKQETGFVTEVGPVSDSTMLALSRLPQGTPPGILGTCRSEFR